MLFYLAHIPRREPYSLTTRGSNSGASKGLSSSLQGSDRVLKPAPFPILLVPEFLNRI